MNVSYLRAADERCSTLRKKKPSKHLKVKKMTLSEATFEVIDEDKPFTVKTDASEVAISAILNQENGPVAFYSTALNASEMCHSSVEKEASTIVEAVRKYS